MVERGAKPTTLSSIVQWPLETFVELLVQQKQVVKVELSHEARVIMKRYNLNPRDRGRKNLVKNLQLDVSRVDTAGPDGGSIIDRPLSKKEKEEALEIAKKVG